MYCLRCEYGCTVEIGVNYCSAANKGRGKR
jgi:hypothetical protein